MVRCEADLFRFRFDFDSTAFLPVSVPDLTHLSTRFASDFNFRSASTEFLGKGHCA